MLIKEIIHDRVWSGLGVLCIAELQLQNRLFDLSHSSTVSTLRLGSFGQIMYNYIGLIFSRDF